MRRTPLTFIVLLVINCPLFSQNWVSKASMPTAGRYAGISFTINGKAYVGLGISSSGQKYHDFWQYDPATNFWTQKANYPGLGLYASTAFAINGKGYVCLGGETSSSSIGQSDLWEYNPGTNTWIQKASFPGTARYGASCFVIGDTAFIGTGSVNNPNAYLGDFWMYVPATNSWTQLAPFPGIKRNHGTAFTIGKFGYMGTGLYDGSTATSTIWRYNKQTNTWTSIANLPGVPRLGATSFVINNKGYLGTGKNMGGPGLNSFYEYDPILNSWSLVPTNGALPTRAGGISFVINGIPFVGTGDPNLNDLWSIAFPDFSYQDTCLGNIVLFQTQNISGSTSFNWNFGDPSSGTNNTSNQQNPSHYYAASGNYTVTLITQQGIFLDTIQHMVTIYPLPQVNLGKDTILCSGSGITLNAGNTGSTYLWSTGTTTQTITVNNTGIYVVTVTNIYGCKASDSLEAIFNNIYQVNIDTSFCEGSSIVFEGQTIASSGVYKFNHTTSLGCDSIIIINATVNNLPDVDISNDTIICLGTSVNLFASGGVYYEWMPTEGLSNNLIKNPIASPINTTIYTVTVTSYSCSATETVIITVFDCSITIPNVFTANGDMINDNFEIIYKGFEDYYIIIFNRWGVKMFESNDKNIHWDGKGPNNQNAAEGVYYYILTVGNKSYHGTVTLLR